MSYNAEGFTVYFSINKNMKIMTILGTRPEIIRLSLIIKKLDSVSDHTLVHTGQNYSKSLKDVFFEELDIRQPNYYLGAESSSVGTQVAKIIEGSHEILQKHRPDKVLILGDTNSGLAAIIAEKMLIPVYHMEAGNRCYDKTVPEEKNRHIIDAASTYNLPYTPRSRENLLREGKNPQSIMMSGNPINEVLMYFDKKISKSIILKKLGLQKKKYFIITAHRAENVDNSERLKEIFRGLDLVAKNYKMAIICSIHPRTKEKMKKFNIYPKNKLVKLSEPFGFFDFVQLEKNAFCAISDSGTVQEECCIFQVPTVTIRVTTERPETIECGSNILSGLDGDKILECVNLMVNKKNNWVCPQGYLDTNVSTRAVNFILGNNLIV